MTKHDRSTVARAFSKEYKLGRKREKTLILSKLTKITGYSRKHLMEILVSPPSKRQIKRHRPSRYLKILKPLKKLWAVANYACGTRLVPMIPVYLEALARHEK